MPEAVIRSESYLEGYRLTTTGTELRIDPTDQHPRSLRLDREKLAAFGLLFQDDHYIDVTPGKEPEGVVASTDTGDDPPTH